MTMPTTTSEAAAIAKARRRIEALLEENGKELDAEKRRITASIEAISAKKQQRVVLLKLLYQHGGDPEQYEMDGAELAV